MFKTLKSKIIAIAITTFAIITVVFTGYAYVFEINTNPLILDYYSRYIEVLKDEINKDVVKIENNSKDLALIGSLFYKTDKSVGLTKEVIKKIFDNYPDSLGGGIWFEPYVIDKAQKRFCFYAFRDKDGKVVIDESFNSEQYNYLNQGWYKQIVSQIKEQKNIVAWSLPYYENQGSNTLMITAGSGIYDDKGNLIGISTVDWQISSIEEQIKDMKFVLKISPQSSFSSGKYIKNHFALLANLEDDYIIVSTDPYLDNKSLIGKKIKNIPWYTKTLIKDIYVTYQNKIYVPYVKNFDNGMVLIFFIPRNEMFYSLIYSLKIMLSILLFLGFLLSILLYLSLNKYIMEPINILTGIAKKIGKGEDVKIKIEEPEEFAQLASTFDKMTTDIKIITKERGKIDSELSIAKSIQSSSLPNVFPPFPDKKEFDIYASMAPAKEVGGDFYDFYFIDEKDNFMFLIADVSGKGVPAALFMMTAKTLINNMAQVGYSPKELIQIINKKMCENNKQGFFVTMLSGIVNIKTGNLTLVNCGHNQPLIKRKDGDYEYMQLDANAPLGILDDTDFSVYETQLNKGDIIFTYTDGITEAMNNDEEMYGEERLLESLNSIKDEGNIKEIISKVKQNLKLYTDSAPQSDDITMLGFKYEGCETQNADIKVYDDLAVIENYKPFYSWLHNIMDEWNINEELSNTIDMCSEELFANITFYAYPENRGNIKVTVKNINNEITLIFEDTGIAYNPLEKPDPDITLPPMERPLGGLGIFMVKNMAKNVNYERLENKNILTLVFDK